MEPCGGSMWAIAAAPAITRAQRGVGGVGMKCLEASEGKHISPDCSEVGFGAGSWTGGPIVLDWGHSRDTGSRTLPSWSLRSHGWK